MYHESRLKGKTSWVRSDPKLMGEEEDERFQVFRTLPVIPPLRAESSVRCNLMAPQVIAPPADTSDEARDFRRLSRSCNLDGSTSFRSGTTTYPRTPYKE